MYEYFGVGPEFRRKLMAFFLDFFVGCPHHHLSSPSRRSLEIWCLVIDNLTANDVSHSLSFLFSFFVFLFFFFFWVCL